MRNQANRLCDPFSRVTREKKQSCRLYCNCIVNLIWNKFLFYFIRLVTEIREYFLIKGVFIWVGQFHTLEISMSTYTHKLTIQIHSMYFIGRITKFTKKYSIFPCDCVVLTLPCFWNTLYRCYLVVSSWF